MKQIQKKLLFLSEGYHVVEQTLQEQFFQYLMPDGQFSASGVQKNLSKSVQVLLLLSFEGALLALIYG